MKCLKSKFQLWKTFFNVFIDVRIFTISTIFKDETIVLTFPPAAYNKRNRLETIKADQRLLPKQLKQSKTFETFRARNLARLSTALSFVSMMYRFESVWNPITTRDIRNIIVMHDFLISLGTTRFDFFRCVTDVCMYVIDHNAFVAHSENNAAKCVRVIKPSTADTPTTWLNRSASVDRTNAIVVTVATGYMVIAYAEPEKNSTIEKYWRGWLVGFS